MSWDGPERARAWVDMRKQTDGQVPEGDGVEDALIYAYCAGAYFGRKTLIEESFADKDGVCMVRLP